MSRTAALRVALVAIALGLAGGARPALACAVCYGAAEGDVIGGARLAIIFMLGLVYAVLGGGLALAVVVRRKHVQGGSHGPTARPS